MHSNAQLIAAVLSLLMLGLVVDLIRRRRLRDEYSLAWLTICAAMLFFSAYPRAAHGFFSLAGIDYTPSAVAAVFPAVLAAIHFTLAISRLKDEVRILAQRNALLLLEVKELREAARSRGAEEPEGANAQNRAYQKNGEAGG